MGSGHRRLSVFALFTVIFTYFPDAEVSWSDVKTGAFVTAAVFGVGKFLPAMYLGQTARQACAFDMKRSGEVKRLASIAHRCARLNRTQLYLLPCATLIAHYYHDGR